METPQKYITAEMKVLLIACCAGVFMMPFMSTMMNLALPSIESEFHVGSKALSLVLMVFLLASVTVMVPLARTSDIIGRKKIFIAGVATTLAGALIGILSPSFEILLVSRFVMGAGSAALSVSSVAMLTDAFPLEKRGLAIGIQSTFIYVGIALGPPVGGFICDHFEWRYLFLFMIPIAIFALIFILRYKKETRSDAWKTMDYRGALIYGATIMTTMIGVINLPNIWAIAMIAVGLVMLLFFIRTMKRTNSPILEISIFKHRVFSRACIAAYMNYAASHSVGFFMSLYLVNLAGLSQSEAGMILLIQPLFQVFLTALFGSISDHIRDKRILPTAGMTIICVGVLMIMFLKIEYNMFYVIALLTLLGIGYGMFAAPNTNAVMSALPPKNRGEASAMIALVRQIGMMTSVGIAGCCIVLIMGSADNLTDPDTWESFIRVIQTAFAICLAMCIVGTFFSWFRGDTPKKKDARV